MKYFAYLLVIFLFVIVSAALFHAYGAAEVPIPPVPVPTELTVVPWGEWFTNALLASGTFFSWLLRLLIHKYLKITLSNTAIEEAVNFAIAAVANAEHGKTMTLSTTNAVINTAAKFAIAKEPRVAKWVGDNLRPMIVAKISKMGMMPEEAHDGNLTLTNP